MNDKSETQISSKAFNQVLNKACTNRKANSIKSLSSLMRNKKTKKMTIMEILTNIYRLHRIISTYHHDLYPHHRASIMIQEHYH